MRWGWQADGRTTNVKLLAYFALYLAAYHGILINFYESGTYTHALLARTLRMCNISFRTVAAAHFICAPLGLQDLLPASKIKSLLRHYKRWQAAPRSA